MAERLHEASKKGNLGLIKVLLAKDRSGVNKLNSQGYSAICEACKVGKLDVVQYLHSCDADIEKGTKSCLTEACRNGHIRVVKFLLDNGAHHKCTRGRSCVHIAAWTGNIYMLNLLSENGVDMLAVDATGRSALHYAMECQDSDCVATTKLLLHAGVEVNHIDNQGASALHIAAEQGKVAALELLAEYGAHVHARDSNGSNGLHYAVAGECHMDTIQWLLSHDVHSDLIEQGERRMTPLMLAVETAKVEVVELLLQHGGIPKLLTKSATLVLELAIDKGHKDLHRRLTQYFGSAKYSTNRVEQTMVGVCMCGSNYRMPVQESCSTNKGPVNSDVASLTQTTRINQKILTESRELLSELLSLRKSVSQEWVKVTGTEHSVKECVEMHSMASSEGDSTMGASGVVGAPLKRSATPDRFDVQKQDTDHVARTRQVQEDHNTFDRLMRSGETMFEKFSNETITRRNRDKEKLKQELTETCNSTIRKLEAKGSPMVELKEVRSVLNEGVTKITSVVESIMEEFVTFTKAVQASAAKYGSHNDYVYHRTFYAIAKHAGTSGKWKRLAQTLLKAFPSSNLRRVMKDIGERHRQSDVDKCLEVLITWKVFIPGDASLATLRDAAEELELDLKEDLDEIVASFQKEFCFDRTDTILSDRELFHYADHIEDYQKLGVELDLKVPEIQQLEDDSEYKGKKIARAILIRWKQRARGSLKEKVLKLLQVFKKCQVNVIDIKRLEDKFCEMFN